MMDLKRLVNDINKVYGPNALRSASEIEPVRCLPFGLPTLDIDLGGGVLWGRQTILAGREQTGKTTLAYKLIAEGQKIGVPGIWIDVEKSFDLDRAKVFGVTEENLLVIRGEFTAEHIGPMVRDILDSLNKLEDINQRRVIIVVDSIAAIVNDELMEKNASAQYGGNAKMVNQIVSVWNAKIGPNQIVLFINQLRDNLDPMARKEKMPGGWAQSYFASHIVWLRNGETLKDGTKPLGKELKWTIEKSRSSAPKEIGTAKFLFNEGFDYIENLINAGIELGMIEQAGPWYSLPGTDIKVKGKPGFIEKVEKDKEFLALVVSKLKDFANVPIWDGRFEVVEE